MSTCCGKLFPKMGKGSPMRFDHTFWSVPGSLGGFRFLWPGIAKRGRRAYGGSILRAGCKSPPAVMAVFRMSPRAPYHATWCGAADTGEIPEPTVTVRMREETLMLFMRFSHENLFAHAMPLGMCSEGFFIAKMQCQSQVLRRIQSEKLEE